MSKKYKKHNRKKVFTIFALILILIVAIALAYSYSIRAVDLSSFSSSTQEIIKKYADENSIDYNEYPKSIIKLLERNSEATDFVLSYPMEHDKEHTVDLSEYKNSDTVPLFMQWDKRWGYIEYSGDVAGLTGCGPVCLSMVAFYLTNSDDMTPDKIIAFAKENGYALNGITEKGSSWSLISEGAEKLGLEAIELPLDENRIIKNLEVGNPIICSMGEGDFTSSGHFIVLVGYENGKIKVNDPNSIENSQKLWEYDRIKDQIKNLWAIRNK